MADHVVLVHGLARRSASMNRLRRALKQAGFRVHSWAYPSRRHRLQGHVDAFGQWLTDQAFEGPVHFVGHSLGGLIIRGALAANPPVTTGRIVMIATPNQGAGVVSTYGNRALARFIFGLPLHDLAVKSGSLRKLGVPKAEIGIIAGVRPFHPFNPVSWVNLFHYAGHEHDGTVELHNTHLKEATDSIAIDAHHTFMCNHPMVIEQTLYLFPTAVFVIEGRFVSPKL